MGRHRRPQVVDQLLADVGVVVEGGQQDQVIARDAPGGDRQLLVRELQGVAWLRVSSAAGAADLDLRVVGLTAERDAARRVGLGQRPAGLYVDDRQAPLLDVTARRDGHRARQLGVVRHPQRERGRRRHGGVRRRRRVHDVVAAACRRARAPQQAASGHRRAVRRPHRRQRVAGAPDADADLVTLREPRRLQVVHPVARRPGRRPIRARGHRACAIGRAGGPAVDQRPAAVRPPRQRHAVGLRPEPHPVDHDAVGVVQPHRLALARQLEAQVVRAQRRAPIGPQDHRAARRHRERAQREPRAPVRHRPPVQRDVLDPRVGQLDPVRGPRRRHPAGHDLGQEQRRRRLRHHDRIGVLDHDRRRRLAAARHQPRRHEAHRSPVRPHGTAVPRWPLGQPRRDRPASRGRRRRRRPRLADQGAPGRDLICAASSLATARPRPPPPRRAPPTPRGRPPRARWGLPYTPPRFSAPVATNPTLRAILSP
jgi:hypothetical protein